MDNLDAYGANQEALEGALGIKGTEGTTVYDYSTDCEELPDDMRECVYDKEEAEEAERIRSKARIQQLEDQVQ